MHTVDLVIRKRIVQESFDNIKHRSIERSAIKIRLVCYDTIMPYDVYLFTSTSSTNKSGYTK